MKNLLSNKKVKFLSWTPFGILIVPLRYFITDDFNNFGKLMLNSIVIGIELSLIMNFFYK